LPIARSPVTPRPSAFSRLWLNKSTGRINNVEFRSLGATGLKVSALSFGTMSFAGKQQSVVGTTDVPEARRLVDRCLDAGINLFDTADAYASGESERVLGEALKGRRDRVVLATKVNSPMGDGPNDRGLSRSHIVSGCEASLRRLGTDWIDLYQVHSWDGQTPLDETLSALDHLVRSGKVRYIGCSNYSAWHLMKALGVADRLNVQRYATQQINYSLLVREAEYELVPIAIAEGVGILVWGPLAGGFLSGKFRRGETLVEGTRFAAQGSRGSFDLERGYDVVEVVADIAEARGVSPSQVALNWLTRRAGVSSVLIGARTEEQLADNLNVATWALSDEELTRLDELTVPRMLYPYWHQQFSARHGPADQWPRPRLQAVL
jgi:aryl-alcohol dehydrogenase-like predicted oxidoreductase